jgi:hypothetical protein
MDCHSIATNMTNDSFFGLISLFLVRFGRNKKFEYKCHIVFDDFARNLKSIHKLKFVNNSLHVVCIAVSFA